jgi:hypothetical protein
VSAVRCISETTSFGMVMLRLFPTLRVLTFTRPSFHYV